jgi:hypothetical protein
MSGIEVTGLVLGAIPVLLTALEGYANGVSTASRMIRYKRELKSLYRLLDTDFELYKAVCKRLLSQIVDPADIAELLAEPGGKAWKNPRLEEAMRTLLGSSYGVYLRTMADMDAAIEEFKERLKLGPNGGACLNLWIYNIQKLTSYSCQAKETLSQKA